MESPSPRQDWPRSILRRIEEAAALLNPFLMIVAVMLAILDMSCYAALQLSRLQVSHRLVDAAAGPSPGDGHPHDIAGPIADR
jgi:hypothetical protein